MHIETGDLKVSIGRYPNRKQPVILVTRGSVSKVVAYCRTDEDAVELQNALAEILAQAGSGGVQQEES